MAGSANSYTQHLWGHARGSPLNIHIAASDKECSHAGPPRPHRRRNPDRRDAVFGERWATGGAAHVETHRSGPRRGSRFLRREFPYGVKFKDDGRHIAVFVQQFAIIRHRSALRSS
jgi:hypothetical protein